VPFRQPNPYVIPSPTGSGTTKNCTPSNFSSVLSGAVAGDVLVLADGNYPCPQILSRVMSAKVTLAAQNKHGAVFTNSGGVSCVISGSANWRFYGIRMQGASGSTIWVMYVGGATNTSTNWHRGPSWNLDFQHCWFNGYAQQGMIVLTNGRQNSESFFLREDCTRDILFEDCLIENGAREGMYLGLDMNENSTNNNGGPHWVWGVTIRGCTIRNMGSEAIDAKACWESVIEDCDVFDCHKDEFQGYVAVHYPLGIGSDGQSIYKAYHADKMVITIRRNRFHNDRTDGSASVGEQNAIWLGTTNNLVENNAFFNMRASGIYTTNRTTFAGTLKNRIRHNTFWNCVSDATLKSQGRRSIHIHAQNGATGQVVPQHEIFNNITTDPIGTFTNFTGDTLVGNVTNATASDYVGPLTGYANAGGGYGSGLKPPTGWIRTSTVTAPTGTGVDIELQARNFTAGQSEPGAWEIGAGGGGGGDTDPPPPPPPPPPPSGSFATPTLVASGGAKTATVNFPSSVVAGDLLVVYTAGPVHAQNGALPATITGTWTKHIDTIGGSTFAYGPHHALFTRLASAAGAQAYTVSMPGDGGIHTVWQVWRNIDPTNPIDAAADGQLLYKLIGEFPVGPSVTTVTPNAVALTFVTDEAMNSVPGPPPGFAAASGSLVGWRGLWHAHDVREATGATGTLQWANAFTYNTNHAVASVALRPVSANPAVSVAGIASTAAIGTPTVRPSTLVSTAGIAATAAYGTPTITGGTFVAPSGIAPPGVWKYDGTAIGAWRNDLHYTNQNLTVELRFRLPQAQTGTHQVIACWGPVTSTGWQVRANSTQARFDFVVGLTSSSTMQESLQFSTIGWTPGNWLSLRLVSTPGTGNGLLQWYVNSGSGWQLVQTDTYGSQNYTRYTPDVGTSHAIGANGSGGQDAAGLEVEYLQVSSDGQDLVGFDVARSAGWTLTGAGSVWLNERFGYPTVTRGPAGEQAPIVQGVASTAAVGAPSVWTGEPQTVLVSDIESPTRFGTVKVFRHYTPTWLAWLAQSIDSGQEGR